jgi:transcriptional regulator with XRE-family HTH domain
MIQLKDPTRIGPTVAALRRMSLASQRDVADHIGMDPARLSDWERGHAVPTLPYLVPALGYLGYELHIVPEPEERHPGARPTGTGWPTCP